MLFLGMRPGKGIQERKSHTDSQSRRDFMVECVCICEEDFRVQAAVRLEDVETEQIALKPVPSNPSRSLPML